MNLPAKHHGKRVRIYLNETDHSGGIPTASRVIEFLRKQNAAGATVMRAEAGFGASGRIHTQQLVDLAVDLPLIVEWVDDEVRVEQLLPELLSMITPGLVTLDDTTIALSPIRPVRDVSSDVSVSAIMTRNPITAEADLPLREVVARMNRNGVRALPVVEAGVPIGMITSGDLIDRAAIAIGLGQFADLRPSEPAWGIDENEHTLTAREIMTAPVVTATSSARLSQVANAMVSHKLKRFPVVDERGAMVGIVSRVDLLRTVAQFPNRDQAHAPIHPLSPAMKVSDVMRRDVPIVLVDAGIPEVIQALISTRLNLTFVVDSTKHVLGLITATELLQRVTPSLRRNTLAALMRRIPFFHSDSEYVESERHAGARNASGLMTAKFERMRTTDSLGDAISAMVSGAHKVVAIVDDAGCLLGVVDRADVLRGVLRSVTTPSRPI